MILWAIRIWLVKVKYLAGTGKDESNGKMEKTQNSNVEETAISETDEFNQNIA